MRANRNNQRKTCLRLSGFIWLPLSPLGCGLVAKDEFNVTPSLSNGMNSLYTCWRVGFRGGGGHTFCPTPQMPSFYTGSVAFYPLLSSHQRHIKPCPTLFIIDHVYASAAHLQWPISTRNFWRDDNASFAADLINGLGHACWEKKGPGRYNATLVAESEKETVKRRTHK